MNIFPSTQSLGFLVIVIALIQFVFSVWILRRLMHLYLLTSNEVKTQMPIRLSVEIHAAMSLMKRFPIENVPTSNYSMRFSNLMALVDLLDERKPKIIVELGSGISSICVASWIREEGKGKLISIDNDANWAALTKSYLKKNDLSEFVDLHVCPLKPITCGGVNTQWYDLSELSLVPQSIDLVIVDGPPAGKDFLARYPAIPMLKEYLSENAVVILDDANRPGEQDVLTRWNHEFSIHTQTGRSGLTGSHILELCLSSKS